MTIYTPQGERAFGYLGVIEAASRARASTSRIWDAVRNEAGRLGLPDLGISFKDVTTIRSWAVRMRNADAAYANANPTDSIDVNMVTTAVWSPQDAAGIAATPNFLVRAQATVEQPDGTVITQWLSWNFADNPYNFTVADYTAKITDTFASRIATAPEETITPTGKLLNLSGINLQVF